MILDWIIYNHFTLFSVLGNILELFLKYIAVHKGTFFLKELIWFQKIEKITLVQINTVFTQVNTIYISTAFLTKFWTYILLKLSQ